MYQIIGIVSGLLIITASIPYMIDIVRGRTKPQRMAWVIFLTLSAISFFAQITEGATGSLWFALVMFVQAIMIFFLTMKFGVGGHSKIDIISLLLSLLILAVWGLTQSAALAIICTVSVNTIGKVLVAIKCYKQPNTEYLPTWVISFMASTLAVISVGSLDWILMLPALQNAVTVGMIALVIISRRTLLPSQNSA